MSTRDDETINRELDKRVIEHMGHISSELAHDLRSPLQTIQNAIYLIQRNPENEQLYVMVKQSLQQATDILDNFREYYKGHILQKLQVDPVKVVELSFSELKIPENVTVEKNYPESAPINIDPAKTALALRKLLQNAVDAMPDGGKLVIDVNDEDEQVTVTIKDTGNGIPEDIRSMIYTPFFSDEKRGKGLGIPTAYRIIASHDGEMSFVSEVGAGTTWTITLPRR